MNEEHTTSSDNFNHIVDLHDNDITLKDIQYISLNLKTRIQYETEFNQNVYSDVLLYLTHKIFPENEARRIWFNVLYHRKNLISQLARDPGIIVATLDYLTNLEKKLYEPKIIEKDKSDYILSSTLIDNLTNLFIRNVFDVILEKEYDLAVRQNLPISLLMIDLDNFKQINDLYGHTEGDYVLKQIGNIVNHSIRKMDIAARYGGEEIVIIMPNTEVLSAFKVAEIIRKKIEQSQFSSYKITISAGVSEIESRDDNCRDLVIRADKALYYAKNHGKNTVVIFDEEIIE